MPFLSASHRLRLVLLFLVSVLSAVVTAQSTSVNLRWSLNAWPFVTNKPQWSNSGDKLLFWQANAAPTYDDLIRVYNTDGSISAQLDLTSSSTVGHLTGACLSADGKAVYYATDAGDVFTYTLATHAHDKLKTYEKAGSPITHLVASKNGQYLAYVAADPSSSNDYVTVFDLNAWTKKQFDYKNPAYSYTPHTAALAFANGDTEIVCSGPSCYTVGGSLIKQDVHYADPFVVSPDGSTVYSHADGPYDQAYAYSASTLSSLWSAPIPSGTRYLDGVSADGKAILFSDRGDSSTWSVAGLNATNGFPLANTTIAPRATGGVFVALSPKTNAFLAFCSTGNGYGYPYAPSLGEVWTFDSSTGAGTPPANALFNGLAHGAPPTFFGTQVGSTVAVAFDETHDVSGSAQTTRTARDARTGAKLSDFTAGTFPSPDGKFYVVLSLNTGGTTGVNVYRVSDGASANPLTLGGYLSTVVWGGSGRFAVFSGSGYILDFDGTTLSQKTTFNPPVAGLGTGPGVALSSDGTKLAVWSPYSSAFVTDLGTGVKTEIARDANSQGIDEADFAGPNRIGVHEVVQTSSTSGVYQNEYRVFDLTASPPKVVQKIAYSLDANYTDAAGAMSPDGATVVMGHRVKSADATDPRCHSSVRLYSVADGKLQSEWDDQVMPDFAGGAGTFTFSPDSLTVLWTSAYGVVAASTGNKLGLTVSPTSVRSGDHSTGTVSLSDPATADTVVTLSSDSSAATVPASVTIPAGKPSADFTISTSAADSTSARITATLGALSSSATLAITTPQLASFTLSPSEVAVGGASNGHVTISDTAPTGGFTVALGEPTGSVSLPTVVVPGGQKEFDFQVTAKAVSAKTTVTITATHGSVSKTAPLTIDPPFVSGIALSASSVVAGGKVQGTVTISQAAPAGGATVALQSDQPGTATVPGSVVVPTGQTQSPPFDVQTNASLPGNAVANIVAKYDGSSSSAPLQVIAVALGGLSLDSSSVTGGATVNGTLRLVSKLPYAVTVSLSSGNAAASVPKSVTIAAGTTEASFTVTTTTVTTSTTVTLTAALANGSKAITPLTVNPIGVSAVSVDPTSVVGGSSTKVGGTVTLSGPAPKGGLKVTLGSDTSSAATVSPSSVTIAQGKSSATFSVTHKAVATTTSVRITATSGTLSKSCVLQVKPPTLIGLKLSPTSGGNTTKITGTVTLDASAPSSGIVVGLSSNSKAVTVPSTVTVKGSKTATFTLTHVSKVTATTVVTITATLNGASYSASVTIKP